MSKKKTVKIDKKVYNKVKKYVDMSPVFNTDMIDDIINDIVKLEIQRRMTYQFIFKKCSEPEKSELCTPSQHQLCVNESINANPIQFVLNNGEEVEAIPVRENYGSILYIFKNCIKGMNTPMHIENSSVREFLNSRLLELEIPDEIRNLMLPVHENDLLRLPTPLEIFGYCKPLVSTLYPQQFECMKDESNRIAEIDGEPCSYWLMEENSDHSFYIGHATAICTEDGTFSRANITTEHGIRPVFRLKKE